MTDFDPTVIEQFADNLYRKASAVVGGCIVVGAMLGAAFGAVPLTSLGSNWPISGSFGIATMLVGGLIGTAIGYVIGDARAFSYRLEAQTALCHLQIERNTSAAVQALAELGVEEPDDEPEAVQEPPPVEERVSLAEVFVPAPPRPVPVVAAVPPPPPPLVRPAEQAFAPPPLSA